MYEIDHWYESDQIVARNLMDSLALNVCRLGFYTWDILPILVKYRTKQVVRNALRRLKFLTYHKQQEALRWLRLHGW